MKILMVTNTYAPVVGGLEKSVETFAHEYRKRGHETKIVAPHYRGAERSDSRVIRVPAIQNFYGTGYSLELPITGALAEALKNFEPEIVHSHHPYLIGDTAYRISRRFRVPLIFTFHTLYNKYSHFLFGDSQRISRFVMNLSVGYANLCDYVFAPSRSIRQMLTDEGVQTPVEVIPTGIYEERFAVGDGAGIRARHGIPPDAYLTGFVSRIAPEKNIYFLCRAVALFLTREPAAHFLIVGEGPSKKKVSDFFRHRGLQERVHFTGFLKEQELVDAYHAMDVFVFASHTETQGLVVTEAMASGVPVAAVSGPGVRDIVEDGVNGKMIGTEDEAMFTEMLHSLRTLPAPARKALSVQAKRTARKFSMTRCVDRALEVYAQLRARGYREKRENIWAETLRAAQAQWNIVVNMTRASRDALKGDA
ncbi:MAG: glycosyltransferase [Candidatus Omnitrophica bacterium]|nr:glycosyltransferase [Candidatus Omnitrophota bacterium]